jgi:hypothetical protein
VGESFGNAYPDKKVMKNTTCKDWKQNFGKEVFVRKSAHRATKTAEITAVLIERYASAATMGYGCKNSILPLVSTFCA